MGAFCRPQRVRDIQNDSTLDKDNFKQPDSTYLIAKCQMKLTKQKMSGSDRPGQRYLTNFGLLFDVTENVLYDIGQGPLLPNCDS